MIPFLLSTGKEFDALCASFIDKFSLSSSRQSRVRFSHVFDLGLRRHVFDLINK